MQARTRMVLYGAGIAAVGALAVVVSEPEDWRPLSLLAALAILNLLADTVTVPARRLYVSAGLLVQVVVMALMGPAPAVAVGIAGTVVGDRIRRLPTPALLADVLIFALLGLIGGLLFDALRPGFGVDRQDAGYAVLVAIVYGLLAGLNLVLVASLNPLLDGQRRRVIRESGVPLAPWELVNAVMAGVTVLVWAEAGLVAVAGLAAGPAAEIVVLVISIPAPASARRRHRVGGRPRPAARRAAARGAT